MICSGVCRRLLCPIAPILLAHDWAVRLWQRPDRSQGVTSTKPGQGVSPIRPTIAWETQNGDARRPVWGIVEAAPSSDP
jgi:hypothetical protein